MQLQVPDDIPKFVRRKAGIDDDGKIMKPDFDFSVAGAHVDMGWFATFVGIEIGTVMTPA
jgi:hypothetical protein